MTTAEPSGAELSPVVLPNPSPTAERAPGADLGSVSGSGPRAFVARHPVLLTAVVAGAVHVIWVLFLANTGGDIAAQDAWAEFVGRHPDSAYNLAWYGGMHPVSYSVVSPYLMSLLGVRTTMMVVGTVSAALTALILVRVKAVRNPIACSMASVAAFFYNALSGRVTFGLGVMFGLGAVAAVFCWPHRWRTKRGAKALVAGSLSALGTAGSPVAGLFLGMIAVALFLARRRPGAYVLGLPPVLVVGLSAWLFPFSGTQPESLWSAALSLIFGVLSLVLVPRSWTTVRIVSGTYSLAVVVTWLVHSEVGSNISRLPMVMGGVVLLAALPYAERRSRNRYWVLSAFVAVNLWGSITGIGDMVFTAPAASWSRELAPLVHELHEVDAAKGRVEVVPARSHREASALSPYVNLARGWNRQADIERNPIFYDDTLTAANYRDWLDRWAVRYVVLPQGRPDIGAEKESKLVRRGQPYLHLLWGDSNWQLYAVRDPKPIADPPATVDAATAGGLTIEVRQPGRVLIRIPYSPWLGLVDAEGDSVLPPQETAESKAAGGSGPKVYTNVNGCLTKAEKDDEGDEWTVLFAPKAGVYRLAAPYQLPRGTACPDEML